jgi:antitoxin FitA
MAQLTVRKLDNGVKERLKGRAKRHGRTLEAEARAILEEAVVCEPPAKKTLVKRPLKEKGLGTLMFERFRKTGLTEEEARLFQQGIDEINGRPSRHASNVDE